MQNTAEALIAATLKLRQVVGDMTFPLPVAMVYNPLDYAWGVHEAYIRQYASTPKKTLFLGINPGPFGMAQTGIPFGEVTAVRDFLKLERPVGRPAQEHPKRPVSGFACTRSEVSGRRLWGLFAKRFGTAEAFFNDHYVLNYCPLLFLEASGCNYTPDKLPIAAFNALMEPCDAHLEAVIKVLKPTWVVGVGGLVASRCQKVLSHLPVQYGQILHPSPANPQANKGNWGALVTEQLKLQGIWSA